MRERIKLSLKKVVLVQREREKEREREREDGGEWWTENWSGGGLLGVQQEGFELGDRQRRPRRRLSNPHNRGSQYELRGRRDAALGDRWITYALLLSLKELGLAHASFDLYSSLSCLEDFVSLSS